MTLLVAAACSTATRDATAIDPDESLEAVVASAIDDFATEFRVKVDPTYVLMWDSLDLGAIGSYMKTKIPLETASETQEPHWLLLDVEELDEAWEVDLAAIDGADYFSGSLFYAISPNGTLSSVDPAKIGVTPTTSVN